MKATHWLYWLHDTPDVWRVADQITAARVMNAILLERQECPITIRRAGDMVIQVHDDVEVTGYGEPFTTEIVDARTVRRRSDAATTPPWGTDDVADLLGLADSCRALLRSNSTTMAKIATRFFADDRQIGWPELRGMSRESLYVLAEQDSNPERPVRNPLALSYQGRDTYHPYLGPGRVDLHHVTERVTTERTRVHQRTR